MNDLFWCRNNCPVCDSSDFKTIFSESFSSEFLTNKLISAYKDRGGANPSLIKNTDYALCECHNCHLIFQRNVPNQKLSNIVYTEWINGEKLFEFKVLNRKLQYYSHLSKTIEKMILFLNMNPSDIKVFDFGMGWGDFCVMCQAYGCYAVGTELSQQKVDYADRFGVKNINLDEINFLNTTVKSGRL